MHEAEPVLYWRVKRNGVWKFERARYVPIDEEIRYPLRYLIEPPKVIESE
jgi:hypothetical protein